MISSPSGILLNKIFDPNFTFFTIKFQLTEPRFRRKTHPGFILGVQLLRLHPPLHTGLNSLSPTKRAHNCYVLPYHLQHVPYGIKILINICRLKMQCLDQEKLFRRLRKNMRKNFKSFKLQNFKLESGCPRQAVAV